MAVSFPTRFEVRCGGISLILSQILFGIAWLLHSIDYNYYDVNTEEDVIELHKILSSDQHRTKVEAAAVSLWLSFPLCLIALYVIKQLGNIIYEATSGGLLTYIAEKAYIAYFIGVCILLPAFSLVSVSYDWSFHESTASNDVVPTGYWIQFYIVILQLELIDCLAVADATFMISYFLRSVYLFYKMTDNTSKFGKFSNDLGINKKLIYAAQGICLFCLPSSFIGFLIILLEFGQSGFFSPAGYAKFLCLISMISKIFIGILLIFIANKSCYNKLKDVFGENDNEQQLSDTSNQYKMEQIAIQTCENNND